MLRTVFAVGLMAMLIALLTGLNERRREMAILRSLGAGPGRIMALMVFESSLLTVFGLVSGVVIELSTFSLLRGGLESQFGLYLVGSPLTSSEVVYLGITLLLGSLIGLIPALRASNLALKDGLSVRV